jgi:hypothetical protein
MIHSAATRKMASYYCSLLAADYYWPGNLTNEPTNGLSGILSPKISVRILMDRFNSSVLGVLVASVCSALTQRLVTESVRRLTKAIPKDDSTSSSIKTQPKFVLMGLDGGVAACFQHGLLNNNDEENISCLDMRIRRTKKEIIKSI